VFPARVRPRVNSVEEVDAAAKELRKRWRLGDEAIPNLCEFLEDKGIKVCAIALPDNVSGVQATVKSANGSGVPVILINANNSGDLQRFTVARELGHLYLDIPKQLDPEPLCHRFAGVFLLPEHMLRKEVGNYRHAISVRELFQLKQVLGVSAQAIAYRCRDLGIISQPTFSGVFKLFGIRKWRRIEPNPVPKERPSRFERLCIRALAEDVISEAKASELLQKTVREVVDSLDRPPDDAQ
jgi:Zn-dependent peptidase ImmA (M78 family)